MVVMEPEIWQSLNEELVYMILARLPMRVLGKMRTVCKKWNYLLSSRDALQVNVPNWSLHSTAGFLIQIQWDWDVENDVEYWVLEGRGSEIYKLPLPHHIVVGSCKSIMCIRRKGDSSAFSIGIPGSSSWRHLPPPPVSAYFFSGLAFDSSTGRCTLLLGRDYYREIEMCIYDSESSAWTQVSMMVPNNIDPIGKGIYCKGKFYWRNFSTNSLAAFDIANGVWTTIPLPQGCGIISSDSLREYCGQVMVLEQKGFCSVRMWKLNEAQVWCVLHTCRLATPSFSAAFYPVTVNSSGLMLVMDWEMNIWIYKWKGKLISRRLRLPGLRTSQRPCCIETPSFESNNLWWP